MNIMMMQRFNTLKERDLEPIDLEKLSELPENADHERDEDDLMGDEDLVRDPHRLRNIQGTGTSSTMWENTVEHAKTCVLDGKLYVYYEDEMNSVGAVFNNNYELRGLVANRQFLPLELLTNNQKISADSLLKRAYENSSQVVEYDGKVLDSLLNGSNGKRASAAAISDHSHVTTIHNKQLCITSEPSPQSHTKNHNPSNSQLIEFPSIWSDTMGGMVLSTPQAALARTMDFGSIGMSAFGGSYLPGEGSSPRDGHRFENLFSDDIQLISSEMLESDDRRRLLKTSNTEVGIGMGYAFGQSDEACYSYDVPRERPLGWEYGQECRQPSEAMAWLKIKAAMRWGFYIRKRYAERRAQFVELD